MIRSSSRKKSASASSKQAAQLSDRPHFLWVYRYPVVSLQVVSLHNEVDPRQSYKVVSLHHEVDLLQITVFVSLHTRVNFLQIKVKFLHALSFCG